MHTQRHLNQPRRALISLALLLLLPGCAGQKGARRTSEPVYRVWPEAPAEPRIAFAETFHNPKEAGLRWTGSYWLSRLLLGGPQGRVIRPFGVALDEANNLCLTDTGNATVCFLDFAAGRWHSWHKIGPVELVMPVAVVKRAGTLYVADSALAKVLAFDLKGKLIFEITNRLERPSGLALGQDKLFVADAAAHSVRAFDLGGKPLFSFGSRGTGPGEFNYPTHLATGSDGRLFVTDSMNFRVQIFDAHGRWQRSFGEAGDGSGSMSRPKGVAVDRHGSIYVVDALFDNVQIFNEAGDFLLAFGERGEEPGEFWLPTGIALSRDDRIYVADAYNRRVQVFTLLPQP